MTTGNMYPQTAPEPRPVYPSHPACANDDGPSQAAVLAARQHALSLVAEQLKKELLGIDDVIDRVINAIRAWYVLPGLITRPVIVCLWGLTGTGKTQLTRRLAQLLGFYDRFVEMQMDGFSNGASRRSTTISDMLNDSGVREGMPGVLVLDEFQRFRTKDQQGADVKLERYHDVWTLLSDGRLPPALNALGNIERKLADAQYEAERENSDEDSAADKTRYRFRLDAWDAYDLQRTLKLKEPLGEIMQWSAGQVETLLARFQQASDQWETDYSKLLIFVCGNLDEMYHETAQRVEDCDTDADIFHRLTSRLSLIDVKKALGKRFKPEQIARLGNTHVVYPSFSKATYEALIRNLCQQYADNIARQCGVHFAIDQDVHDALYANAVFPAQGTRPLFSSVHAILSANLVHAALWVLEGGLPLNQPFPICMGADGRSLQVAGAGAHGPVQASFPVTLELSRIKQRTNADFRALLAVHEAGHALAYCLLVGRAPQEVKINIASFEGGYNSFTGLKATTRQNMLDMLCVGLAGRAAEAMVFGDAACTTGAQHDLQQATADAASFIRHHGFGDRLSRTDATMEADQGINTDVEPSNAAIEALLQAQYQRACALLAQQRSPFTELVDTLVDDGLITPQGMQLLLARHHIPLQMTPDSPRDDTLVLEPFAEHLAAFRAVGATLLVQGAN